MTESVNVLCVDDIEENLVALTTLLARPGLHLVRARSGTEALEALLHGEIALALVDVNMPGMDGFELAELMRGSTRTRDVPIIFLTASSPNRNRMFQGYDAGAVDFLFKPLDPQLLLAKVEVFVQLHRQKEQLAHQLDQLQQAQRMSDLFVGVLGHDLRNPLSSIATTAALLEARPGDADDIRRKARLVLGASRRMERLIQQVLDFALARLQGVIPIEPVAIDLAEIAPRVIAELGTSAVERVTIQTRGDAIGHWDGDRLMQLLSNLISNAVEHGVAGVPISLTIDATRTDEVVLEVDNRGTIPEAARDLLFSPFKPRERHSRGLGLGLYIVDQIVRSHGGTLQLMPHDEHTRFRVTLPRHAQATPRDRER
jgi:signal transduction histidine kinase